MTKHAKFTNPNATDQNMLSAAAQADKICLPPLSSPAFAGIAAWQINDIRQVSQIHSLLSANQPESNR